MKKDRLDRRTVLAAAAALALPAAAQPAWPTRPLKLLVGFPPGSGPDLKARLLTEPLARALGEAVVVENRPGASGNIAADLLAKSGDGHTLGLLSVVNLTTAKLLYPKLPYDPTDFLPLTMVGSSPLILVASNQAAPGSVADFVAEARRQGDTWNFGSPGRGTVGHLGMELVKARAGWRAVHVPFPGVPQILNAMLGGQVQMALVPVGQAMPAVRAGRVRAIGSTGAGRSVLAPEVPSLREAGVGGVDLEVWNALAVPRTFAPANAQRLLASVQRIIRSPEVRQQLFAQGWQAMGTSPEALQHAIRATTEALGGIIRAQGISAE
jgi:tripartite-type tricarboxylate transporter receptor subunit TctC